MILPGTARDQQWRLGFHVQSDERRGAQRPGGGTSTPASPHQVSRIRSHCQELQARSEAVQTYHAFLEAWQPQSG